MDVIWAFPVILFAICVANRAPDRAQRPRAGTDSHQSPRASGCRRSSSASSTCPYVYRPGARPRCSRWSRRSSSRPRSPQGASNRRLIFSEILPERDHGRHRAAAAHDRDDDPHRGGALVPRRWASSRPTRAGARSSATARAALHAAVGGDRPGHHDRAHRARAERARRRRSATRSTRAPSCGSEGVERWPPSSSAACSGGALVMFVITVLVFLIFFETPGVDPARQIAGRNPSAAGGHGDPAPVRPRPARCRSGTCIMMKKLFITPRSRVVLEPGPVGRARDRRGDAGDAVARVRRGRHLGGGVDHDGRGRGRAQGQRLSTRCS